ncbi:hypothetical protein ADEAN_000733600 [Angomonas deanei]|uniref:Uncharacterized protein n=1 Tax=Angomonas deanei TaxID=59799 RepID=A0A7G2CMP2_9TRYP|nr:hypothetical protein ADEAN_000733600 [Angomonas deanei]
MSYFVETQLTYESDTDSEEEQPPLPVRTSSEEELGLSPTSPPRLYMVQQRRSRLPRRRNYLSTLRVHNIIIEGTGEKQQQQGK